jgi:hypothetical protein
MKKEKNGHSVIRNLTLMHVGFSKKCIISSSFCNHQPKYFFVRIIDTRRNLFKKVYNVATGCMATTLKKMLEFFVCGKSKKLKKEEEEKKERTKDPLFL